MKTITIKHVQIFEKYLGDDDGFARSGTGKEKEYFQKGEWALIGNIIQDLELIENGLASKKYEEEINRNLQEELESDAIEALKRKTKKHNQS
ncbi:hypothetical protein I5M27_09275 [Adhaeribacter sp. BT258]|uniref:Uncharacterized protein n=1 Tax=Adhaeribacter terrigena TaxID=2793070 RepID=A0ABS1C3Q4_9BACT|nr:hypothetical protein [Adhaeribacter terrigena]MBK0403175.1 hypothetical protein [Adhaeribacter terrigena]